MPNTLFYRMMSGNYDQSLSIQLQQSLERLQARYASPPPELSSPANPNPDVQ